MSGYSRTYCAKLPGYTHPPCAACGEWRLSVWVRESEEAPTGWEAGVECLACGTQDAEREPSDDLSQWETNGGATPPDDANGGSVD